MNALYTWRFNPLYHSGAVTQMLMVVLMVTGVYLIFFYRISAPYESVDRITNQVWFGRWIRSFHRYASDAAVVSIAFHMLRVFVQDRTWGPRTLAWISGLTLLFVTFVCGWTGYVMVWDVQAMVLAVEGARFLDVLPIFSEPIGRTFVTSGALPSAFFFLNLFLHVALPLTIFVVIWIHVSRIARPRLFPPKKLTWSIIGLLVGMSVIWPILMGPEADVFRIAEKAPFDVFYSFWLPITKLMPAGLGWLAVIGLSTLLLLVPLLTRPAAVEIPKPSTVNEALCDACRQCYIDCPYEAIAMIDREDSKRGQVAHVHPELCVSCGICSASCAPMSVGPPLQNGRVQLAGVKEFINEENVAEQKVVIVACGNGAGGIVANGFPEAPVLGVECAGSIHTSVLEYLVRAGAQGVLVAVCPPHDCWSREGPQWMSERIYNDREAELQPRVDKRRIRVAYASAAELPVVYREYQNYLADLDKLDAKEPERNIDISDVCIPQEIEA